MASLPTREAWIEIRAGDPFISLLARRFLHGKRGLKLSGGGLMAIEVGSLPTREAWIEIGWQGFGSRQVGVASYTGSVD